jgi:transglutaminase-like putative cysteine protease
MWYDRDNHSYYRGLFDKLAARADTDEEKIDRICKFVATRLDYKETTWSFPTPKDVIVRGSCYCSNLALAMAAITFAGDFPTRTVHLSDNPQYTHSHVTVEVYYQDGWHLYDPTYGTHYHDRYGATASYKELRLDPGLARLEAFSALGKAEARETLTWMLSDFASGYNQIYRSVSDRLCATW